MCGRYTWSEPKREEFAKWANKPDFQIIPRYNRAPGQSHPVITSISGAPVWSLMSWGNSTVKTKGNANFFPINARSETVTEKPFFRKVFFKNRCLIPADGWFEWQNLEGEKIPHHIFAEKKEAFAFAGIWKLVTIKDVRRPVFSILTRQAPPNLSCVHHRAPVAMTKMLWEDWLHGKEDEKKLLTLLSGPQPDWSFFQVSKRVNFIRNDDSEILLPRLGKQSLFIGF